MSLIALVRGMLPAKQTVANVMSSHAPYSAKARSGGTAESLRDLLCLHRRVSRQAARAVIAGISRGILPWSAFREWLGCSSGALVGVKPADLSGRLLAHARALRLHLDAARNARAHLISFCKNHRNSSVVEPWLMRVLEDKAAPALSKSSHIDLGEVEDEFLLGMYPRETTGEKTFRWTGWLSAILVHPPRESTRVAISTHPFTPELQPGKDLLAFHDGTPLNPVARQHGKFVFQAPVSRFPRGGPAWLTLVCRPFTAPGDPRALGLPIGQISYHRPSSMQ